MIHLEAMLRLGEADQDGGSVSLTGGSRSQVVRKRTDKQTCGQQGEVEAILHFRRARGADARGVRQGKMLHF